MYKLIYEGILIEDFRGEEKHLKRGNAYLKPDSGRINRRRVPARPTFEKYHSVLESFSN